MPTDGAPQSTAPILWLEHVFKAFPGVQALDDVTFELLPAEVHVLLGENGAGKSTLVKILSGAYQPDAGTVRIGGEAIRLASPHDALRRGISTIYQEFNLVPELSAAANIFLGREPHKPGLPFVRDERQMIREAQRLLDGLGASVRASAPVATLSVSQQQMVEIAKALSMRASIVIMDEPSATLSEREVSHLFEAIRRLQDQGIGIIYISHRLEEAMEIGNRATILRNGRVIATIDVKRATKREIIRLMTGRSVTDLFPKEMVPQGDEALRVEALSQGTRLRDISFSVHHGEIVGIAGLVGSGRSRLARTIFGLQRCDQGRVYVDGRLVRIRSVRDAIRHGIAYLPEDRKRGGLVLGMSIRENASLVSLSRFVRAGQIINFRAERREIAQTCRQLQVKTPSLSALVDYLSGGNQQKVVLAKWLLSQARIFIFDEPTRGIDVGAKVEVYRLMSDLVAGGAAILMISSDLPEVLGISDRVLVMAHGRITAELDRSEASEQRVLEHAFEQAS